MVQVIKRTKVDGKEFETTMAFSDSEWKILQKHYPSGGVSFELAKEKLPAKPGRAKDDDKPRMRDYNTLKDKANGYFKEGDWDKALYYYEEAYKLKSFPWLVGKINACKNNGKNK